MHFSLENLYKKFLVILEILIKNIFILAAGYYAGTVKKVHIFFSSSALFKTYTFQFATDLSLFCGCHLHNEIPRLQIY